MKGKEKCNLLKSIRCQIAKKNHIEYTISECTYEGDCKGTCPKCEQELGQLSRELEKLKSSGKRIAVAGIAAALVATSATGCSPKPIEEPDPDVSIELTGVMPAPEPEEEPIDTQLRGEIPYSSENESPELTGDIADPDQT